MRVFEGPVELPRPWKRLVGLRANESVEAIQTCLDRGRPFGEDRWVQQTAKELNLEASLRPHGGARWKGVKIETTE